MPCNCNKPCGRDICCRECDDKTCKCPCVNCIPSQKTEEQSNQSESSEND